MSIGKRVDNRLQENLNKFKRRVNICIERGDKENPTEHICFEMLRDLFGYDDEEIIGQVDINGDRCDALIKTDGKKRFIFECKKINEDLEKHVKQLLKYCASMRMSWGILSNAQTWQIYYFDLKKSPVQETLVHDIDLCEIRNDSFNRETLLYPFCKEAQDKDVKEDILLEINVLDERNITKLLLSDSILEALVKEMRRRFSFRTDVPEMRGIVRELIEKK
ncbi:MAG: type I restriction enzyme HsdR N-terminal domain-containing protein [Elusimicrobia bacterium]|nr:type I restriction enzyme HsdR N-terminal domain-containing protein [Elusimicrobiota bacterium]MDY6040174.1 type I restriction enzyme HsdR N-terminal domain-containing protein [Elusimicrobiaceae bacterium]